ncbi:MAG: NADH-quinone oxidoreductase subunit J [Nitrospirae bacterium]|nr:NADH-quinone oxidoreductase subunit J [Nitrospirota bacterium]
MTYLSLPDLVFYGVAAVSVTSAAFAVFSRNIVRAVFSLLATFFGVAVIYGMLAADFVAVVQVMVYVGGILVLMLFAVMLTSQIENVERSNPAGGWGFALLLGIAVCVLLVSVAIEAPWRQVTPPAEATPTTVALGEALLGPLVLPLVTVGLLLLGTVIGAVTLTRRRNDPGVN